jgi:hypothetical protein
VFWKFSESRRDFPKKCLFLNMFHNMHVWHIMALSPTSTSTLQRSPTPQMPHPHPLTLCCQFPIQFIAHMVTHINFSIKILYIHFYFDTLSNFLQMLKKLWQDQSSKKLPECLWLFLCVLEFDLLGVSCLKEDINKEFSVDSLLAIISSYIFNVKL